MSKPMPSGNPAAIRPMSLATALGYFGIPAAIVSAIVYLVMPWLDARGLPFFWNYFVVYATFPMLALIAASLIACRWEGHQISWPEVKKRFRLGPMGVRAWLWTAGLTLFMLASVGLLSFTSRWLASSRFLAPPDFWPAELNPAIPRDPGASLVPTEFLGQPLEGNGWVLLVFLTTLAIATLGEELWWRGYILPRQELTYGERTWLVHGSLWAAFHVFAPWNLLAIYPGCLALAYVAQKLRNTWPGIIAHALANGMAALVIACGIFR